MSAHARFAPSSAGIWGACPGAIKMGEGRSSIDTPESLEGSAAHEIGARMIEGFKRNAAPRPADYIGSVASNGCVITEEEFDAALIYASDVANIMRATRIFAGLNIGVEQPVGIPEIHAECAGTPDCFIYAKEQGLIYLWDYKHGHGIVDPFENPQLICYLAGLITLYGINGHDDQRIRVHARIVQPRGFHRDGPIREWSCMLSDIRPHINRLHAAAVEAMGDNPRIISGPQCQYCASRHECPAAREGALSLYESTGSAIPEGLTGAAIGSLYALIKRAKAQIECMESGVEEQIKARIRAGENIPGCRVEEGFGRETWSLPAEDIAAMADLLGVDLKKPGLITPAQAIKKGLDPSVVASFTIRPSNGFKVVIDNNQKARSVFNG